MVATAFFGLPVHVALISPEAAPARSILLSCKRDVEIAEASCPICNRESCRFAVPLEPGRFSFCAAFQFKICISPWRLPPQIRANRCARDILSGVTANVEAPSRPEAWNDGSRHSTP